MSALNLATPTQPNKICLKQPQKGVSFSSNMFPGYPVATGNVPDTYI